MQIKTGNKKIVESYGLEIIFLFGTRNER